MPVRKDFNRLNVGDVKIYENVSEVPVLSSAISDNPALGKLEKINWDSMASVEGWPNRLPSETPESSFCQAISGHCSRNQLMRVFDITLLIMLFDSCQFLEKPKWTGNYLRRPNCVGSETSCK